MAREWTKHEDLQPGVNYRAQQPEQHAGGLLWTQRVVVEWPTPSWTWMTIRDHAGDMSGKVTVDTGRIWPVTEEDGA